MYVFAALCEKTIILKCVLHSAGYVSEDFNQVITLPTGDQSNLTKGHVAASHGWLAIFARLCQCSPSPNICFLVDRSAILAQLMAQRPFTLQWATLSTSTLPRPTGDLDPI